ARGRAHEYPYWCRYYCGAAGAVAAVISATLRCAPVHNDSNRCHSFLHHCHCSFTFRPRKGLHPHHAACGNCMDAVFCHNTRSNISLTRYDRHHEPASGIGVIASGISPGQEKGMKSAIVILSSLLLLTACGGGGGGSDSDSSNDAQPRYTVSATAGAGGTVFP